MFANLLLCTGQSNGPFDGLFVTRLPISREAREAAKAVLSPTRSSRHDGEQTRLHTVPVLDTRVWIDEDAWQDQRMLRQRTLYEGAGHLESASPALQAFETAAFAAYGRKGAPKPERKLVVSRSFILQSGGRRIVALCRRGLTEHAALIPATRQSLQRRIRAARYRPGFGIRPRTHLHCLGLPGDGTQTHLPCGR